MIAQHSQGNNDCLCHRSGGHCVLVSVLRSGFKDIFHQQTLTSARRGWHQLRRATRINCIHCGGIRPWKEFDVAFDYAYHSRTGRKIVGGEGRLYDRDLMSLSDKGMAKMRGIMHSCHTNSIFTSYLKLA